MKKKWDYIIGISLFALSFNPGPETDDQIDTIEYETTQQLPSVDIDKNYILGSINIDNNKANVGAVTKKHKINEDGITIDIVNEDSITVLVNKNNRLSENYIPEDLVTVSVPTVLENPEVRQMRKEAADALKQMFDEAVEEGIYLHARSGYRSYQTQVQLFKDYVSRHGEEAANRYSARPGQSEHQTGLVMDIASKSVNFQLTEQFGDTEEGIWLRDHAHEFGFIIRYPKDMEHITGYIYEPWHIRYMGVDVAKEVYESGLTYEEFLVEKGVLDDVHTTKIETE